MAAQNISFLLSQVRTASAALVGGKAHFYETGTTTNKKVWLDSLQQAEASNPYTLDSNATAQLYGNGTYRIVIKTAAGVTKFDWDGVVFNDLAGVNGADQIGFSNGATGSSTRTVKEKLLDITSLNDFAVVGDGVADDLQAFTDAYAYALVHGKVLHIPAGTYRITGAWTISGHGVAVIGDGYFNTEIILDNANGNAINVTGDGYTLKGFKVNRSQNAVSGSGIKVANDSYGTLEDIWSFNHYLGFELGPTARSVLAECRAENNFSHGFYFATTSTNVAMQWQITACLSEFNNGYGWYFAAAAGTNAVDTTGPTINNVGSYDNGGGGWMFTGAAGSAWNDIFAHHFYSSFDGNTGFSIQNLGRNNQFTSYLGESAGRIATGRGQLIPASGDGAGFEIGSSCRPGGSSSLNFSGICQQNSEDGFVVYCSNLSKLDISKSFFQNNGINVASPNRHGISITDLTSTADIFITNTVSGNTASETTQTIGITADSAATAHRIYMSNCDVSNNSVSNINPAAENFNTVFVKGVDKILGYIVGEGGSVTQATSKTTNVSLSKQSGKIIMHNETLTAGASAIFWQNNTTVSINDTVIVNITANSVADIPAYTITAHPQTSGNILYCLKNVSSGPLSEAVVLNYTIIKGSIT